jgi:hypothetical protein
MNGQIISTGYKPLQRVMTPDGPGLYQGHIVSYKVGVPTKLIVSHNPRECPKLGAPEPFGFYQYMPEDVKPYESLQ